VSTALEDRFEGSAGTAVGPFPSAFARRQFLANDGRRRKGTRSKQTLRKKSQTFTALPVRTIDFEGHVDVILRGAHRNLFIGCLVPGLFATLVPPSAILTQGLWGNIGRHPGESMRMEASLPPVEITGNKALVQIGTHSIKLARQPSSTKLESSSEIDTSDQGD
jgi:hypothetical protein